MQCDLKKDAIVRPMYAEILSIDWQARLRVFRDYWNRSCSGTLRTSTKIW